MENLAGNKNCDPQILKELTEAEVDVVQLSTPLQSEVPASIIGQLPDFQFHRAWYYWVVKGKVPLNVAKELYDDPNGREDVRVAGHCGCPPPEEWAEHFDHDGKRLYPLEAEEDLITWENATEGNETMEEMEEIVREARTTTRYVENPIEEAVKSIVSSYHIDTQEGLNFFVTTLRKHGVVPPKEEKNKS